VPTPPVGAASSPSTSHTALIDVWPLIENTHGDPLAPFAMAADRHYVFSADATAAVSYRVLTGYAVAAGDPIGNPDRYAEAVEKFATLCWLRGWRIVVLGVSDRRLTLWQNLAGVGRHLTTVPIGRDVVIDVNQFALNGRAKRNLRQAVQRTHNAGITTAIAAERDLNSPLRTELRDVMLDSGKAAGAERGFCMMLGDTLSGRYPGVWLIIARDRVGRVQGFHRYASAGGGTDLSLDLPWRRTNAPNGVDERLSVDMVEWAKSHGVQRVSLAFAPLPELYESGAPDSPGLQALRAIAHAADRFIKLESLYRYVDKFHTMDRPRYVLFPALHVGHVVAVLLTLEFSPHRSPQ
jgi:lysylphosphatidylglycerol synthetase-like protein (DUF2156 family)